MKLSHLGFIITALYSELPAENVEIEQHVSNRVQPEKQIDIHRYIITGGPGVGKTTIANYLKTIPGCQAVDEAATRVIKKELSEGVLTPWEKEGFDEKIVAMQKEDRDSVIDANITLFFDRTSIDSLSYCIYHKTNLTQNIITAAEEVTHYYNPTVFLVENFGECEKTAERPESLEEAKIIEGFLEQNYAALGFHVVHVKPGTVEERVEAILKIIQQQTTVVCSLQD